MARYSVDIDAPADVVYALIADVRRRADWLPELESVNAPDRTLRTGDRFDGRCALLGHRFIGTSDVVLADTDHRLEDRVVIGASFRTSWAVTPADGRDSACRVEHRFDVDFPDGLLGRVERWLLKWRLDRLQRVAMNRLRAAATG